MQVLFLWLIGESITSALSHKTGGGFDSPISCSLKIVEIFQKILQFSKEIYYLNKVRKYDPVYNSVPCMNGIFSFRYQPAGIYRDGDRKSVRSVVFGLTRALPSKKLYIHDRAIQRMRNIMYVFVFCRISTFYVGK